MNIFIFQVSNLNFSDDEVHEKPNPNSVSLFLNGMALDQPSLIDVSWNLTALSCIQYISYGKFLRQQSDQNYPKWILAWNGFQTESSNIRPNVHQISAWKTIYIKLSDNEMLLTGHDEVPRNNVSHKQFGRT